MKLIANKTFTFNGEYYEKDEEVKANSFEEVSMLNEKGFIKPLTRKELESYLKNENKPKKEEENLL